MVGRVQMFDVQGHAAKKVGGFERKSGKQRLHSVQSPLLISICKVIVRRKITAGVPPVTCHSTLAMGRYNFRTA